jgi:hypothetical protein
VDAASTVSALRSDVSDDEVGYPRIAISELAGTFSPRQAGECPEHVEALAQAGADLPPIVVHWPSMKVVDGMHRLRAAQRRGANEIAVRFVDGSEDEAFVLAVEANVRHGLPLTLADRRAAAAQMLLAHPDWSDRRVASSTGLAPGTIAAVRRRIGAQNEQLTTRVGRDNRRRAVRQVESSKRTAEQPRLSTVAGRSPQGEVPAVGKPPRSAAPPAQLMATLRSDPSVRLNARGRAVLQMLAANNLTADEWIRLPDSVPSHQACVLAQLAEHYAWRWRALAQRLRDVVREA